MPASRTAGRDAVDNPAPEGMHMANDRPGSARTASCALETCTSAVKTCVVSRFTRSDTPTMLPLQRRQRTDHPVTACVAAR